MTKSAFFPVCVTTTIVGFSGALYTLKHSIALKKKLKVQWDSGSQYMHHVFVHVSYNNNTLYTCVSACVCVCERERERHTHTHTHTQWQRERSLSHLSIKQTVQITCRTLKADRSGPTTTTNEQKYKLKNSTLHTACVWILIYAILWKAGYKATVEPSTLNEVSHTRDEEEGSYWCLILLSW